MKSEKRKKKEYTINHPLIDFPAIVAMFACYLSTLITAHVTRPHCYA